MAVASADHRPTGPKENREYVLSVGNKYRKLFKIQVIGWVLSEAFKRPLECLHPAPECLGLSPCSANASPVRT